MIRPIVIIYTAIALDVMGIGLIFPILPHLIGDVTHTANVAPYIGVLTALYAAMQFVFAPMLGALSDRLGRRPLLCVSLAGAAINYVLMALAPSLTLLIVGRAIAGLTGANISIATAYITDITPPEQRASRFGLLHAMFGVGFILGPVLGGLLGDIWLRLPFVVAAGLDGANFAFALFLLPESKASSRQQISINALNPLRPLAWGFAHASRRSILSTFFVLGMTGEIYGVSWALWGHDVFHWNGLWIGLSLAAFGVCQAMAQTLVPGPLVQRLGERNAVILSITAACIALTALAFVETGWWVFALMPVLAFNGLGAPILQSFATQQVSDELQGQFQGVLTAITSLAAIIGPLMFSTVYFAVREHSPGWVWLSAVAIYAVAIPLVLTLPLRPLSRKAHSFVGRSRRR